MTEKYKKDIKEGVVVDFDNRFLIASIEIEGQIHLLSCAGIYGKRTYPLIGEKLKVEMRNGKAFVAQHIDT